MTKLSPDINKIKICFVIPSLQAGGMERVMSVLANHFFENSKLKLYVVLYGREPEIFYSIPKNAIVYAPSQKFNHKARLLSTVKRLQFLRKTVIDINPDSILSFGEYWNSFVLLALWRLRYPVYISDRCSPIKKFGLFHRLLRHLLYPKATGIIAQTRIARQILASEFLSKNIVVIGNPVINNSFAFPYRERENIILSVGRLIDTKHYDRLIRLFQKVNAPGWKLIILGSNALNQDNKTKLESLVHELELGDRVVLEGTRSNVFDYYNKSKIFAFTSSSEGFPNVIGEALSAGLPVISYDCVAGPSDLISDGENGYLVPVFNDELFREKLQLLIDDENLSAEMSNRALDSIHKFKVEYIGEQYLSFITSDISLKQK